MDNSEKEAFHYTYSAKRQEEIKAIRSKYAEEKEDKMTRLRRLDAGVTRKASIAAITVGIIGALILGFGMSLIMSELGEILGAHQNLTMPIGVFIGVVGIVLICCAYPIYNRTIQKERKKIAPQILRLTDELMQ